MPQILERWQVFFQASPLRRLGYDALLAAVTSIVARGVGFVKEIVVALYFGLSGELDIYFVAFSLIGFPLAILLNAIQTVFISKFSVYTSLEEAKQLFGLTISGTLLLLMLILPVWLFSVPYGLPVLASGFSHEKQQALEQALLWLSPYYFMAGINLLGYGVLQAKRRYIQNGLLPVITPFIVICVLLTVGNTDGWHVLVETLVVGTAMESLLLFVILFRMGLIALPRFSEWPIVRPVFVGASALLPATMTGACVMLVEQSIAASMGEGSNAALAYGYRLPSALQSLVVTAIGITALPYFSSQIAQKHYDYCLHSLNKLFWVLGIGSLSVAFLLVNFSAEIVSLIYQRGAFDSTAASRVTPIQTAYFVQIPFALLSILAIKTLSALGRNVEVGMIVAFTGLLQCFLAYGLTQRFDVVGIAWGATMASGLTAFFSFTTARSVLKRNLI